MIGFHKLFVYLSELFEKNNSMKISPSFGSMYRLQQPGDPFFMQRICIPPINLMNVDTDFLRFLFMKVLP